MTVAASSYGETVKFIVAILTALVGIFTLWVNGRRAERGRRRELYAGGWAAVQAYKEFAFAVRRRSADDAAGERVRISEALREVQKDLAYYEGLIGNEPSGRVAAEYRELVAKTREIAGGLIRDGWNADPITRDDQMHGPDIFDKLKPLKEFEDAYNEAVREELAWWHDLSLRI
jgi:hypothetical protein